MASLHKQGNFWYIVKSVPQDDPEAARKFKTVWINTGTPYKREAENFMAQVEADHQKGIALPSNSKTRFQDFVNNEYLPWAKANKSPGAYHSNVFSCNSLTKFLKAEYLSKITPYLIEQFKISRRSQVSERTVNIELTCLKQIFSKAEEWSFCQKNPATRIKKFSEPKKQPRFLSQEEIIRLTEAASPRLRPFIIIAAETGMRYGEILHLRFDSIDFGRNVIMVRNDVGFKVKNRKDREIPLSSVLAKMLKWFMRYYISQPHMEIKERTPQQKVWLFCDEEGNRIVSMRKTFQRAAKRAGLPGVTPHTLRHTFASHCVMDGIGIRTVQVFLGHSNLKITEIYTHLSNDHKQESIKRLGYSNNFNRFLLSGEDKESKTREIIANS
jgi:site-specific recombinase XerD